MADVSEASPTTAPAPAKAASPARAAILELKARIGQSVLGQDHLVEGMLMGLLANGNLLIESLPGLARTLCMASIMLLSEGDLETGARLTGATYRLVHEKGVMLAPVRVLHLPDPAGLARELLGEDRARELMAEGEALTTEAAVALLVATPAPMP